MISPSLWTITCDDAACDRVDQHESRHMLKGHVVDDGWQLDVKLNGERAKRGGKDYCPDHRRPVDQAGGGS